MSYRCDFCQKTSQPGEKLTLVPAKTRSVTYQHQGRDDTLGSEIVSEMKCCPRCPT